MESTRISDDIWICLSYFLMPHIETWLQSLATCRASHSFLIFIDTYGISPWVMLFYLLQIVLSLRRKTSAKQFYVRNNWFNHIQSYPSYMNQLKKHPATDVHIWCDLRSQPTSPKCMNKLVVWVKTGCVNIRGGMLLFEIEHESIWKFALYFSRISQLSSKTVMSFADTSVWPFESAKSIATYTCNQQDIRVGHCISDWVMPLSSPTEESFKKLPLDACH